MTADLTFNSTNAAIPQTVTIPILDDLLLEGSEVFNVTLTTNSAVLASDFTTVTIEDVDGKLNYSVGLLSADYREGNMTSIIFLSGITVGFFCPGSYSVAEDAGSVNVTVEILRGTPARDVTVTLQTVDGSARGRNGKQGWLNGHKSAQIYICSILVVKSECQTPCVRPSLRVTIFDLLPRLDHASLEP